MQRKGSYSLGYIHTTKQYLEHSRRTASRIEFIFAWNFNLSEDCVKLIPTQNTHLIKEGETLIWAKLLNFI